MCHRRAASEIRFDIQQIERLLEWDELKKLVYPVKHIVSTVVNYWAK